MTQPDKIILKTSKKVEESPEKEKDKPELNKYFLNGEWFDEEEIRILIRVSESRDRDFNTKASVTIFFYHCIFYFMTPIVGIPLIWIFEGFNLNLAHNMQFVKIEPGFFLQTMFSICITMQYPYFYQWIKEC